MGRLAWQAKRTLGCGVWQSLAKVLSDRVMHIEGMGGSGGGQPNDGANQRRADSKTTWYRSTTASSRQRAAAQDKGAASGPWSFSD